MPSPKYATTNAGGAAVEIQPDRKALAFEVANLDGGAKVWWTKDGSDPVPGQNGVECLPAVVTGVIVKLSSAARPVFKFKSSAAVLVQVKNL